MVTYVTCSNGPKGRGRDRQHGPRHQDFAQAAEKVGAKVKQQYWTIGKFDGVLALEALTKSRRWDCWPG